jgi:4-amino-4-deoxy-L-arabinose transferase-like glycosyltransferase
MQSQKNKKKFLYPFAIVLLLLVAFFLRIIWIDTLPGGLYPDEAVNGTDALLAWKNKDFQWFYENNNGREGLYINLISLSTALFGNTILGLKFWSLFFGTLTILGIYLLGKELFASHRIGLISAFLGTFSFWALNFSRIGFRAILLPLILTFSFYFLFRGIRTKTYLPFFLAGGIFGLGFHTYIAFRLAPAILIILFFTLLVAKRRVIQTYWKHILLFLTATLFTASPMLYDFTIHPEHIGSRSSSISVFAQDTPLLPTITETTLFSLAKYFVYGDQNWRHNHPSFPILDIITSLSFFIALIWSMWFFLSSLWKKFTKHQKFDSTFIPITFLLGWFTIMLAPEFLTVEGLPHALRAIGTQPAVFILASLPFVWIFRWTSHQKTSLKKLTLFALFFLFFCIAFLNIYTYFILWGQSPESAHAFDRKYRLQGEFLAKKPFPGKNVYVFANGRGQRMDDGLPVSADVLQYITFSHRDDVQFLQPETEIKTPAVILFMEDDARTYESIQSFFGVNNVRKEHFPLLQEYTTTLIFIDSPTL